MSRYFAEIRYLGTPFSGWQIQPNALTIQEVLESALHRLYGNKIDIVGCGRTDAGVHASQYYFHFDLDDLKYDLSLLAYKLNAITQKGISVRRIFEVDKDTHARFDAISRSYVYKLHFDKNPFLHKMSYKYDQSKLPDFNKVDSAARVILDYKEFYTFCKSNTDVETYKCEIMKSYWNRVDEYNWEYHVTANRFLRGMVRLLVGMCLNVGIDKIEITDVRKALDVQARLEYAWSVPAEGLYLSQITYPSNIVS